MTIKYEIKAFETFLHVHLDNCSINITRNYEGVGVAIWEKEFEGAEPLTTTYAFNYELKPENES